MLVVPALFNKYDIATNFDHISSIMGVPTTTYFSLIIPSFFFLFLCISIVRKKNTMQCNKMGTSTKFLKKWQWGNGILDINSINQAIN